MGLPRSTRGSQRVADERRVYPWGQTDPRRRYRQLITAEKRVAQDLATLDEQRAKLVARAEGVRLQLDEYERWDNDRKSGRRWRASEVQQPIDGLTGKSTPAPAVTAELPVVEADAGEELRPSAADEKTIPGLTTEQADEPAIILKVGLAAGVEVPGTDDDLWHHPLIAALTDAIGSYEFAINLAESVSSPDAIKAGISSLEIFEFRSTCIVQLEKYETLPTRIPAPIRDLMRAVLVDLPETFRDG